MYTCKVCVFFNNVCKEESEDLCPKFFPKKIDTFTNEVHKLKKYSLQQLLLLENIIDLLITTRLKKSNPHIENLEKDQEISFNYHGKTISAKILTINKRTITVKHKGEEIRLSPTEIILKDKEKGIE